MGVREVGIRRWMSDSKRASTFVESVEGSGMILMDGYDHQGMSVKLYIAPFEARDIAHALTIAADWAEEEVGDE